MKETERGIWLSRRKPKKTAAVKRTIKTKVCFARNPRWIQRQRALKKYFWPPESVQLAKTDESTKSVKKKRISSPKSDSGDSWAGATRTWIFVHANSFYRTSLTRKSYLPLQGQEVEKRRDICVRMDGKELICAELLLKTPSWVADSYVVIWCRVLRPVRDIGKDLYRWAKLLNFALEIE